MTPPSRCGTERTYRIDLWRWSPLLTDFAKVILASREGSVTGRPGSGGFTPRCPWPVSTSSSSKRLQAAPKHRSRGPRCLGTPEALLSRKVAAGTARIPSRLLHLPHGMLPERTPSRVRGWSAWQARQARQAGYSTGPVRRSQVLSAPGRSFDRSA